MKSSATAEAREALIAEFVSQWSFANEAEDAEFGRSLRGFLTHWGCHLCQVRMRRQRETICRWATMKTALALHGYVG